MLMENFFGSKTKRGERITVFLILPLLTIATLACTWILVREATKPPPREAAPAIQFPRPDTATQPALEPAVLLRKLAEAEALEKEGASDAAEAAFAAITMTNPESDRGWGGLGRAMIVHKKYREAVAALDQAIRLNLISARHFAARGAARRELNDLKHAIRDYRDALTLEPGNILTSNTLLFVALEMRDTKTSDTNLFDRTLEKVRQPNPGSEAAWMMALAVSEMRAGNTQDAVDILKKASQTLSGDQYKELISDRIFADKRGQDLIAAAGRAVAP